MYDKPSPVLSEYARLGWHIPPHDPAELDVFPSIRDFLRLRLRSRGLSQSAAAEAAGLPDSTVSKYLSGSTRDASLRTVGPLCRVAGLSLDEYFCITTDSPELLIEKRSHGDDVAAMLSTMEEAHRRDLLGRRRLIYSLLAIFVLQTLILSVYLLIDAVNLDFGLVRGRFSVSLVVLLLLLLVFSIVYCVVSFWRLRHEVS